MEAREALSGMKAAGLAPDVWAYTAAIEAHRASKDVAGAEAAYREMENDGVAPNVACFNALLRLYGATGQLAVSQSCHVAVSKDLVSSASVQTQLRSFCAI